ncbi:MAG: RpiB/LacA/LacB family sugar-phosphate isomerase [Nanoarchaeota archaeon]
MKVYIGADHAGFKLKEKLKRWMDAQNIAYEDLGNTIYDKKDDYPLYAERVAHAVAKEKAFGILVCGSAQGVCIAANKIPKVRAVVPFSVKEAKLSREHEDANILCLSGWYFLPGKATKMVHAFLNTPFSKASRHVRRIREIKEMEK